jgi:UDP-N-acetylmuramate: L-alanyl-gamma-D-glutamyl-meso-diaminopimelate ligase
LAISNLDPALNRPPDGFALGQGARVHLVGVGGVAMASLAGLLHDAGCLVSGSDLDIYPPASCMLGSIGLVPSRGYGPETIRGRPDLVVVGNVVTRAFPVLGELARLGIHYLSLPQTLERFFLSGTRNLVVAGCHGKTSLTNLVALLLDRGGLPSGHFVGGASLDFPVPWRLAPPGGLMALEGDEYDCAFFDKNPKFLHYRPSVVALTSVEYDHADIYPSPQSIREAYLRLMALMPPEGLVIYNGDDAEVAAVAASAPCRRISYGVGPGLDLVVSGYSPQGLTSGFSLGGPGLAALARFSWPLAGPGAPAGPAAGGGGDGRQGEAAGPLAIRLPKPGLHNALNAAAATACFLAAGGRPSLVPGILAQARGVRRRQQVLLDRDGLTLIDDFAHHPTAVASTLSALRAGFPGRRILAAFEPRSNTSRRAVFQEAYARSLRMANLVFLSAVDSPEKAPVGDRLDVDRLARDVGQTSVHPSPAALARALLAEVKSGDMVVLMSNGGFGGLAKTLREALDLYLDEGRFTDSWLCSCGCCHQPSALALQPRTGVPADLVAGYRFRDPSLLESALTHRSVLGAKPCQAREGAEPDRPAPGEPERDNQRLEFLGDSVLNLIIAQLLFRSEPRRNEGDMTRHRACLVCESRLAEVARGLDLGFRLTMSQGEDSSGGRERPSVLADAMEAVLGAVYLDGGFARAAELVERLWGAYLDGSFPNIVDHKSRLQEATQRLKLGQPSYALAGVSGPSHSQTFTMSVEIGDLRASASGTTKKMAGQRAARDLFLLLAREYPGQLD